MSRTELNNLLSTRKVIISARIWLSLDLVTVREAWSQHQVLWKVSEKRNSSCSSASLQVNSFRTLHTQMWSVFTMRAILKWMWCRKQSALIQFRSLEIGKNFDASARANNVLTYVDKCSTFDFNRFVTNLLLSSVCLVLRLTKEFFRAMRRLTK